MNLFRLRTVFADEHHAVQQRCTRESSGHRVKAAPPYRSSTGPAARFLTASERAAKVSKCSGASAVTTSRQEEEQGVNDKLQPVQEYLEALEGQKVVGVYALADGTGALQYVGYSRNIPLAVKARLVRVGPARCALVRTMAFNNAAMATSANMAREAQHWIEESMVPPPGNGPGSTQGVKVTEGPVPPRAMTVESVDVVLDEVRPFLAADGGDVEVVDVAAGVVFLRLEGACGSCASSATTMRLGIETSLRAAFGDQLEEVVQVEEKNVDTHTIATVSSVDARLAALRIAILGVGGRVEVVDVKQGVCVVKYKGPEAMGQGIATAIKDTFSHDDMILKRSY